MAKVVVIGASSLIGSYFIDNNFDYELICFSRNNKNYNYLDLKDENTFYNFSYKDSFLVSFAPIWLLSKFLVYLVKNNPKKITFFKKIIVCSSSSVVSKRFAFSSHDKFLVSNLLDAENQINNLTSDLKIPTIFLRPSMIYGEIDDFRAISLSRTDWKNSGVRIV